MSNSIMENKVFYGEYSLSHWIKLMERGDIKLPEYQREFVWAKEDVESLMVSLHKKLFVPPVVIGSSKRDGNIIIDGQQRLTSILLAYYAVFPNQKHWKKEQDERFIDDNDDYQNDDDDELPDPILKWEFKDVVQAKKDGEIKDSNVYERLVLKKLPDWDNSFLGFSYIVPAGEDWNSQQSFYADVFREINIGGKQLTPMQSRAALYWLDKGKKEFFRPANLEEALPRIKNAPIDFVRYLSLTSEYAASKSWRLAYRTGGKKEKMESYYLSYISKEIGKNVEKDNENENENIWKFESLSDKSWKERYEHLKKVWKDQLKLDKIEYKSVIDIDLALFGLLYYTVFEGKEIEDNCEKPIVKAIQDAAETFKKANPGRKPSRIMYLRERFQKSITIYGVYIK